MSTRSLFTARRVAALAALPLLLGLAGCSAEVRITDDAIADDPTLDEGDVGGHDAVGDGMAMCAPGVTDCVDVVVEPAADDQILPPDLERVDALPEGTRMVEMAPDAPGEVFPIFLQQAVVEDQRVHVGFSGGEAPCFFIHHVEVEESASEVVVRVFAGGGPTTDDDCTGQEISLQGVTADLAAPVGDRALLDGSRVVSVE